MKLDIKRIKARTQAVELAAWPRIIPDRHRGTPADAGFGSSRFSSPSGRFRILYAAQDFPTALAEAVIRDRFVGKERRYLYRPYLESLAATEISTVAPLALLDLTGGSTYELGIDTDAKGSRAHDAGQRLAEQLHDRTSIEGILFSSRLTNQPCVAVFDRAFAKLKARLLLISFVSVRWRPNWSGFRLPSGDADPEGNSSWIRVVRTTTYPMAC